MRLWRSRDACPGRTAETAVTAVRARRCPRKPLAANARSPGACAAVRVSSGGGRSPPVSPTTAAARPAGPPPVSPVALASATSSSGGGRTSPTKGATSGLLKKVAELEQQKERLMCAAIAEISALEEQLEAYTAAVGSIEQATRLGEQHRAQLDANRAEEAASKAQRESKMAALKAQAAAQGKSAGPKLPEAVTPLKLHGVARPPEPEPESPEAASCSSTDSEEE